MAYPMKFPAGEPILTVTNPKPFLWIIELHNGQDNRLTSILIRDGILPALHAVERSWRQAWRTARATSDQNGGKGALIVVGRRDQDKFFSNGLDFPSIREDPDFFLEVFNPLLTRLLEFPIPTIAALNGHCIAGGLALALACDYRIIGKGSGRGPWIWMNEVHFGSAWPLSFVALMRAKLADHRIYRQLALEGYRFTPAEALHAGLVDFVVSGGTQAVLAKAEELAEEKASSAAAGAWGVIRADVYKDIRDISRMHCRIPTPLTEDTAAKARLSRL